MEYGDSSHPWSLIVFDVLKCSWMFLNVPKDDAWGYSVFICTLDTALKLNDKNKEFKYLQ